MRQRFRQGDPEGLRSFGKDNFVPLNRLDVFVKTGHRPAAKKSAGRLRRIEDRGLNVLLAYDPLHGTLSHQLII